MLLDRGADPCLCAQHEVTPLHAIVAANFPLVDVARLLLEHGAGSTIYRRNRGGMTVLDYHSTRSGRMKALLRKYFILVVRKYVIGGNAEHPSRNRMKHLAPRMASFLI